ncbi:OmpH family outer membrane protein, partial [Acinetobacter baumannii]
GSAVPVVVPAAFADVAPATIIVVDVQAILSDSKAAVGVQQQLDSERNNFQKEISAQEGKLRTGEQELARQRTILSADAFEQK